MEKVFGELELEKEDYKNIAKMVWEEDKNEIIKYTKKMHKLDWNEDVEIADDITFEEFYTNFDNCVFWEYDNWGNWNYYEKEYRNS